MSGEFAFDGIGYGIRRDTYNALLSNAEREIERLKAEIVELGAKLEACNEERLEALARLEAGEDDSLYNGGCAEDWYRVAMQSQRDLEVYEERNFILSAAVARLAHGCAAEDVLEGKLEAIKSEKAR